LGVALQSLSASELADTRTVLASFMGEQVEEHKTVSELLSIYRQRAHVLPRDRDSGDDLRVDRFIGDMSASGWDANVVIRVGVFDDTVLVIDGIHRGIAYLACIEEGISPDRLPALHVDC
jgi:hypothetical protein